jgi:hypothetical protein
MRICFPESQHFSLLMPERLPAASNFAFGNLMILNLSHVTTLSLGLRPTQVSEFGIQENKPINYYEYQNFYNLTQVFS